jgi:LPXTG-motif cell wall-anchored protein
LIFLVFVAPLAIYFLVLAIFNRSNHPIMVPGTWDFVGVLLAGSGFLLLGGPTILSGLHEEWRLSWLLRQTRFLNGVGENWYFWISLWGLYLVLIVAGSAFLIRRRKNQTSIYNIEPDVLERVLVQVLDRLGLESRRGDSPRFLLRYRERGDASNLAGLLTLPSFAADQNDRPGPLFTGHNSLGSTLVEEQTPYDAAGLDIEPMPAMRHVTLHWFGASRPLRQEVESRLGTALAKVETRHNPAGTWFLSLAIGLFLFIFLVLTVAGVVWIRLLTR